MYIYILGDNIYGDTVSMDDLQMKYPTPDKITFINALVYIYY